MHISIVGTMGAIQGNFLKSRIILEDVLIRDSGNIAELNHCFDSIKSDLTSLEFLLIENNNQKGRRFIPFRDHHKELLGDIYSLTGKIDVINRDLNKPDSSLMEAVNDFEQGFTQLQNLLPQYLLIENLHFKREIIVIVLLNFIIFLLAGFFILRLTRQLTFADRNLIRKTLEVENRERERIAADLHDSLGSLLSGLIIHIQVLEKESEKNPELTEKLQHLNFLSNFALQSIEEIINNLNPSLLTKYGLVHSLEKIIHRLNKLGKTQFSMDAGNLSIKIPESLELTLYRISSELLNNALKHSSAKEAGFQIFNQKKLVHLIYWDNGVGFDPELSGIEDQKSGLSNLVRRVEAMEGNYKFSSRPGLGVKIEVCFDADKV